MNRDSNRNVLDALRRAWAQLAVPRRHRELHARTSSHQTANHQASGLVGSLVDDAFLRRLERLSLVARRPASAGIGGDYRSRARAHSAEFVDYRAYAPGDDLRRIDWNVYRRLGQVYVKLAEAREHLVTCVLLDCSASMQWGQPDKLTFARSLTAALGYVALGRNDLVSVACIGQRPRAMRRLRGRGRALELLRFLDGVSAEGRVDLPGCLSNLGYGFISAGRASAQVILISDLLMPIDALARSLEWLLVGRLDVAIIHVLSPDELDPQPGDDVRLIDSETGQQVEVGLSLDAISRYHTRMEEWQEQVQALCWQRGVRYVRARSDEPLEEVVLSRLRERLVLA